MSEPDPKPPQPRAISAMQWLSLLTPSTFTIAVPLVMSTLGRLTSSRWLPDPVGLLCLNLLVGIVLCFVFGFRLEKWRWGSIRNEARVFGQGILILIVNTFTAFAGCTAFTDVFRI